jgi:hypothetical protein
MRRFPLERRTFHRSLQRADLFARSAVSLQKEAVMKFTIIMLSILFITDVGTCLAIDASICTPGSDNTYYPSGQLKTCTLKDNFEINGVTCKQYETINLYETGMLRNCITNDNFNYDGITCNQYGQVSFYETGILNTCILSKTIQIDGKTCEQLQPIFLFENGKLKSCSTPPL